MPIIRRQPTPRPAVFRTYWAFAAERHRIFERRLTDDHGPWTEDPILREHRFTNVFRAADRVSQHLIAEAAYGDPDAGSDDLFLRVVLHRLFCRPSTWDLLAGELGEIKAADFSADVYGRILDDAFQRGTRLYTGAYISSATRAFGYERKHHNHLALLEAMLADGVPARVATAASMKDVFKELEAWPLIGPFMAYQLAIDLNYSTLTAFSEDDFTVAGPGAMRGLDKVFLTLGDYTPSDAIHWLVSKQTDVASDLGIVAPRLFGRALHAIDCQNLLCEVDKYCRVVFPELASNRRRIKQRFRPSAVPLKLFFPPDWGLNERAASGRANDVLHPAPV